MVSTAVVVWQGVSFAGKCCVYVWNYCCKVYWRSFKSEFEQHVEVSPSRLINWLVHNSFGAIGVALLFVACRTTSLILVQVMYAGCHQEAVPPTCKSFNS